VNIIKYMSYLSPFGTITAFSEEEAIIALEWGQIENPQPTGLLNDLGKQLELYFEGKLEKFDVNIQPEGTAYQKSVWQQMLAIPYGQTRTYGEISKKLTSSPRAVGTACGKNPIPIIIPCHRIISANGSMGGYSAGSGVSTKINLLNLEGFVI